MAKFKLIICTLVRNLKPVENSTLRKRCLNESLCTNAIGNLTYLVIYARPDIYVHSS